MNFPDNPSGGDLFNGFIYNATLGVWDVATSDGYFAVTNNASSAYVFNGFGTDSDSNPTLYLHRGKTYEFAVNATGHPFYIKTVSGTGTGNAYSDGVTNNGTASGTIKFVVPQDAPSKLYYNCSAHAAMAGEIIIPRAAQIDDLSDVDTSTTAPTDGQVLTWDNANSKWEPATASGGIALTDISVTTNTAGTAALAYSNSTGVFTYTPPDLSGYLTSISGQSIEDLSDVNTMTPTDGQVLTWDNANSRWDAASPSGGSYNDASVDTHLNTSTAATNEVLSWNGTDYDWVAQSGGGGASVTTADTAPSSPSDGDLWYDTTTLRLYVYYDDGTSSQWVKANPSGPSNPLVAVQETAPSNPSTGHMWFDPNALKTYIYYNDGDSSQWVQANPTGGGSSGIALTDLSVGAEGTASGDGSVTYNNTTGVFTYTPPDLSSYLTSYTETNNLTAAVTWADVPDANITQTSVTQHQAALSITESQISDLGTYLTSVALNDVSDVTITTAANGQVLKYNGTAWVNATDSSGIALTDLSVTTNAVGTAALSYNSSTGAFSYTPPDLSSYLTSYTVTQSDVTAHQAALSITESQISDFGTYLTSVALNDVSDVTITTASNGQVLKYNGTAWVNAADSAGIALTDLSVTTNAAGTAALSYNNTTGAFSYTPPDLSSYLTSETNNLTAAVTWANVPDANITQSSVTQHQAALSITESQISDLQSYLTNIAGQSIENLSDVNTMTPTDGQVLTWDNANSRWDATTPSAGGGGKWTELATATTDSTGATAVNLDGMTAAYNIYKVIGEFDHDYDGAAYLRVRRNGVTQSASEYSYTNKANRYGTDTFSTVADNGANNWPLYATYTTNAEYPFWFEIFIVVDNNRATTGKRAFYHGRSASTTTSGTVYAINNMLTGLYSGTVSGSNQITGVSIIRTGTGTMKIGKFGLYGWKV
jgi:uncharacterized protein (DUF486 family)